MKVQPEENAGDIKRRKIKEI